MTVNRIAPALLVLTTACSNAMPADGQATAKTASIAAYDIAGVRIGMSLDEARRVLESKGFKVADTMKGPSFAAAVDKEIGRMRGTPVADFNTDGVASVDYRKPGEKVDVGVVPAPNGGTVMSVNYMPDLAGRSVDELRAQMLQRYGQPTTTVRDTLLWCAPTDPCDWRKNAKPSLSYSVPHATFAMLSSDPGSEARAAAKAVLDAAVRAKVGKPTTSF